MSMLAAPKVSVLGQDPTTRKHRINANSFQQNAITTVNGHQYVAFYTDSTKHDKKAENACFVNLARRSITSSEGEAGEWQTITFEDYEQTADDGHNTISIGVCRGDGTIHIAFDHHCDRLKFRISKPHVTTNSQDKEWTTALFSEVQDSLPGLSKNELMTEVTYPRFVNAEDDLTLTYRIGQAGLGSDLLYSYSSTSHSYLYLGQHLTGIQNSPYINGIDYRTNRLHLSWCYRNFIQFDPSTAPDAHKQQAGPNGPENNYDLCYAWSGDGGRSWRGSEGEVLAVLRGWREEEMKEKGNEEKEKGESIPGSILPPGRGGMDAARVFDIPMGSGILNQEAQTVDGEGGFWALNRENGGGVQKWVVYWRGREEGKWKKFPINSPSQPTETGNRAAMCADRKGYVYLILPGNKDSSLSIMRAGNADTYEKFETIWKGEGFDGEPHVDLQRLEGEDVLSVFTRTDRKGDGMREVVVVDFEIE